MDFSKLWTEARLFEIFAAFGVLLAEREGSDLEPQLAAQRASTERLAKLAKLETEPEGTGARVEERLEEMRQAAQEQLEFFRINLEEPELAELAYGSVVEASRALGARDRGEQALVLLDQAIQEVQNGH